MSVTRLAADAAVTLARAAAGTAVSLAVGAPLGLWLGLRSRRTAATPGRPARAIERVVDAIRSTPPIAIYPLLLVLLGYGEAARLGAVVFGAAGLVVLETAAAVARAPAARREVLAASGAGAWQRLAWLEAFEALPGVAVAARAAFSIAMVVVLVSEMLVGAERGLGTDLVDATLRFDAWTLAGVIAVIGAVGALANAGLAAAGRRLVRW